MIGRWFNGTLNYRGFKGDLYEGGLRVPGIVAWPGRVKPGSTSAVLFGGWKGVWMHDTLRLFNVTRDPEETKDLAPPQPDVVRRLTEIRDREDKRVTHPSPPKRPQSLPYSVLCCRTLSHPVARVPCLESSVG